MLVRPLILLIALSRPHIQWTEDWFAKHGPATVFWARMIPVVRTFISLPAGVAKMPFWRFILYTFLGCIPWMFMLTFIGLQVGERWTAWRDNLHYVDYAIVAAIVVGAVWLFVRARRGRGGASTDDEDGVGPTGGPAEQDEASERSSTPPARTTA